RLSRREFLQVGGLGLGGLSLASLLRQEARGAATARPKSGIYICLGGGPSHIDMWDLKPDAPEAHRGPFTPIAAGLPAVQSCEHMPLQAQAFDQFALLRGIRSVENDHFLSEVYSGLPRIAGHRPAFGCVVSRFNQGNGNLIPPYICLDRAGGDQFKFE